MNITGTGVAIITPFSDNKVDYDSLSKVIEHVIIGGIDYIVALGSTGETATLNEKESRSILDFVIDKINGRVPLVAGNFGANNTTEICKKLRRYNFDGIDAILSSSPAYVKPNQEGIFQHFKAMSEHTDTPIILYNVPGRTQSNMEWYTTVRLAEESSTFIGIKEATGNLIQTTRILKNRPKDFKVVSGDDEVALPMIACGGDGVISVMANVLPKLFSDMMSAALSGDFISAKELNFTTYDLHHWLYVEGNPVGIKAAMEHIGLCKHDVRLPLSEMSIANYQQLTKVLDSILGS